MTIWKQIPGYPGYEVSDDGQVRSFRCRGKVNYEIQPRILKPYCDNGYLRLNLMSDKKRKPFMVHRLVLLAFQGPCPDGMEVRHLNGNPSDNKLENLCYGTRLQNAGDRVYHGTQRYGDKMQNTKFTNDQIIEIKELLMQGKTPDGILLDYDIPRTVINSIGNGGSWKKVGQDMSLIEVKSDRFLDSSKKYDLVNMVKSGMKIVDVANIIGCDKSNISRQFKKLTGLSIAQYKKRS